jgi:hypothetical protein
LLELALSNDQFYYIDMQDPNTREPIFCEDCPMKGEIEKQFDCIRAAKVGGTVTGLFHKPYEVDYGTYGVLTDIDRNTSEPIRIPDFDVSKHPKQALGIAFDHIKDDIALCEGPDTELGRIRRTRQYIVGCHALRGLSLEENLSEDNYGDPEDIADKLKQKARVSTYADKKPDLDGELRDLSED